jgi:predicted metalloendopeptidase
MLCVNPLSNNKPNDDFYTFVNESWLKNTEIPNDKARYGTFNILHDLTEEKVKELVESAMESKDDNYRKVGILFNQGLKKKKTEYGHEFNQINYLVELFNSCQTNDELFELVVRIMLRFNLSSPFDLSVGSDYDNPKMNILHLSSGGLGLPDRDYYIVESEENISIRKKYKEFLKDYIKLFNFKTVIDVDVIYELERKLAEKTHTKTEKRNIEMINHPMDYSKFVLDYPKLSFISHVFDRSGTKPGKLNISNPKYFELLNSMVSEDLNTWKSYFILKFILDSSAYLTEDIDTLFFNFYGKVISGKKEKQPIWKTSLGICENLVGDLIGKMYTDKYFPKETKDKALELVEFIKLELGVILEKNTWMQQVTKSKALEKLTKMNVKIGYPDKIDRNYDLLEVVQEYTYFENILFSKVFVTEDHIKDLYKPVDFKKWYMNAHMVNAYYSPNMNDIVFPAGILQEPFFSVHQDWAYNFGGIGAVIGHEITHGFDDEGRKFDGDGLLKDWWTSDDEKEYSKRTELIVEQYSQYSPLNNDKKVNGKLTLGENIADIGGVYIAYKAYMQYLKKYPNHNKVINNITPAQRFFMNYANVWKNKSRDENTMLMLVIDPHSPPIFRVNGTLKNIDEFYECYNIKEGDEMFMLNERRGKIWNI